MNCTKEGQSLGGRNASQKVYYCDKCGGIGSGNRMVSEHLAGDCEGIQGRKLKKSTERNSQHLEEAIVNTAEWRAEQRVKMAKEIMKDQQARVLADIEELRSVSKEYMGDALQTYYSKIF